MAKEFQLSVVAPDRAVVETTAQSVIAPGLNGYFGVMAGHVPTVFALRPGLVEYIDQAGQRQLLSVDGGFAEVSADRVTILADGARMANEIRVAEEEEKLERARKALRGEDSTMTSTEAIEEIEKATARIRAIKR